MPLPDFRIASTMEKLDCSVLSAPTAACGRQMVTRTAVGLAYRVVALLHDGKAVVGANNWEEIASTAKLPRRDHVHEGMALNRCRESRIRDCRR
jgi:hypothetical protein